MIPYMYLPCHKSYSPVDLGLDLCSFLSITESDGPAMCRSTFYYELKYDHEMIELTYCPMGDLK